MLQQTHFPSSPSLLVHQRLKQIVAHLGTDLNLHRHLLLPILDFTLTRPTLPTPSILLRIIIFFQLPFLQPLNLQHRACDLLGIAPSFGDDELYESRLESVIGEMK